jgi:mRNA interferase MazF
LILQSDAFNRGRIKTVIAVAITSNMRLADAPGNVVLKAQETGLPRDSVANVSQVITIDRSFLVERCGRIAHATLHAVEDGLRLALSL